MEKECIISCQLSYIPIGSSYTESEVERVLEIIRTSFPSCVVGEMSTFFKGPQKVVLKLLDSIISEMDQTEFSFSLQIGISNVCGCSL